MMQLNEHGYGVGENSYNAAGKQSGITALVDAFYLNMDTFLEATTIRKMHSDDLSASRKKLTYFLCGWLGGPRLYSQHYGGINIPSFHKHFKIGTPEMDAWLFCMEKAIEAQPYATSFREYLLAQLRIPAQSVKAASTGRESFLPGMNE